MQNEIVIFVKLQKTYTDILLNYLAFNFGRGIILPTFSRNLMKSESLEKPWAVFSYADEVLLIL